MGRRVLERWPAILRIPRRKNMTGSVLDAIGNTPVVKLQKVVPRGCGDVVVKLEFYNPTGSYKDRMALAMIEEAEKRGDLRPGMRVIEYTGGSTGSSLAMVCAAKGYRFEPLSSDAFAQEKILTMRAFGGDVTIIPSEGGKITPGLFDRFKEEIKKRAGQPDTFYTDQLNNRDTIVGYRKIGEELLQQLDGNISAFCGAVGSGGMLVGVSRALRGGGCPARIVALEPAGSPFITTGKAGPHHGSPAGEGRRNSRRNFERPKRRCRDRPRPRIGPGIDRGHGCRRYRTEVSFRRFIRVTDSPQSRASAHRPRPLSFIYDV